MTPEPPPDPLTKVTWRGVRLPIYAARFLEQSGDNVEYRELAKFRGVGPKKIAELQRVTGLRVYRKAIVMNRH